MAHNLLEKQVDFINIQDSILINLKNFKAKLFGFYRITKTFKLSKNNHLKYLNQSVAGTKLEIIWG